MSLIPAFGRQRQADLLSSRPVWSVDEFQERHGQSYTEKLCLGKKKPKKQTKKKPKTKK